MKRNSVKKDAGSSGIKKKLGKQKNSTRIPKLVLSNPPEKPGVYQAQIESVIGDKINLVIVNELSPRPLNRNYYRDCFNSDPNN